jgi:imidazolonepropionase
MENREPTDLLIVHASQLCVIPPQADGPQRGHALGELGLVEDGALAIRAGRIVAVGPSNDLEARYASHTTLDASGKLITPGLVDPHTHLIWAGDRAAEFERRIAGATYHQIMAAGGGIAYTTRATRAASLDELVTLGHQRLDRALAHGSTTVEIKTGYGLETAAELKMLDAIAILNAEHPARIVPTFLGAHALPPEFAADPEGYISLVIEEMLRAVAAWKADHWPGDLFCDVFCEDGAFSLEQTRRILEAALAAGLKLKIHVDEFVALGGTTLGVELGATSLDHLDVTPDSEIAHLGASGTVAVLLPTTPFGLGQSHFPSVRKFLDAGAIVALATDCNPGPAWTENMQFVLALATRYLRLTPAQALAACTLNAAHALALGKYLGSLAPGYAADLVIWQTSDYRELGYHFGVNLVDRVLIDGRVVPLPGR